MERHLAGEGKLVLAPPAILPYKAQAQSAVPFHDARKGGPHCLLRYRSIDFDPDRLVPVVRVGEALSEKPPFYRCERDRCPVFGYRAFCRVIHASRAVPYLRGNRWVIENRLRWKVNVSVAQLRGNLDG